MSRRSTRRSANRPRVSVRVLNTAVPPAPPAAPRQPAEPFRPSLNAVLLLAVIMLAAVWTWLYSDWFSVFSSTIGLTAALGVVPALRGYMSAERNKQWGKWIDDLLFQSRLAQRVYPVLLVLITVVGFGLYQPVTLRVADTADPGAITLALHRGDDTRPMVTRVEVVPGKTHRQPVRRPLIGGPTRAVLRASDVPPLARDLTGLWWKDIAYPFDFWAAPAVLLYPGPSVLGDLRDRVYHLEITATRDGVSDPVCKVQRDYLGEPVWLGTGGHDLPVDSEVIGAWRERATLYALRNGPADLADRIITTSIAPDCLQSLAVGDQLNWVLIGSSGASVHGGNFDISQDETYPVSHPMEVTQ